MLRTLLRIDSVLIFVLAGASSAADTCQLNIFDNASKLILVSTADMRATAGTLQIFERPELAAPRNCQRGDRINSSKRANSILTLVSPQRGGDEKIGASLVWGKPGGSN